MPKPKTAAWLTAAILVAVLAPGCRKADRPAPARDQAAASALPRTTPLARKDAFFGLHFDLHPQATDTSLGADISEANIRDLLERVKPDFVQYDCKGHAGWAGYPTAVGWASPGIVKDSLAVWRKATRDVGVGLYIHYSGVWDSKAVAEHPDWARIDANGTPRSQRHERLRPLRRRAPHPPAQRGRAEVRPRRRLGRRGVLGGPARLVARGPWRPGRRRRAIGTPRRTGPTRAGSPGKMFHRRAFERYLAHWIDAVHASNPALQLTSNWMYTTFAPKPVEAKLDFLSGDYSPSLSVDRARVEARYLASTGMPWDLMAWGFDKGQDLAWSIKPAEHLMQEASVVLMQGGGFQIYHTPTRSGYIVEPIIAQEEAGRRLLPGPSGREPQVDERAPGRPAPVERELLGPIRRRLRPMGRRLPGPRGRAPRPAQPPLFRGHPGRAPAPAAPEGVPARRRPRLAQADRGVPRGPDRLRRAGRKPAPAGREDAPGSSSLSWAPSSRARRSSGRRSWRRPAA